MAYEGHKHRLDIWDEHRERRLIRYKNMGMATSECAKSLGIAYGTVNTKVQQLRREGKLP